MKNRGYTLLELLGVIVILALLTALVFPSVLNAIKKSSNQTDKLSMDLISNAADLYIENHANDFKKRNGNKFIIEMNELMEDGFLPKSIKLSDLENISETYVLVKYNNNKFNYEIKSKNDFYNITGTNDLVIDSDDYDILDYKIYGNSVQNGTPTPESPIEIESVGDKTKNLFNKTTIDDNKRLFLGNLSDGTERYTSDFIDCKGISSVSINLAASFAWYDEEKNIVSSENKSVTMFRNYTKPDGARYLKLDFDKSVVSAEEVMLVEGDYTATTMPTYEPYGYRIPIKASGKNLIPYSLYPNTSTNNGIKWTNNNDGTLRIQGVSTGFSSFNLLLNETFEKLLEDGEIYTISLIPVSGTLPEKLGLLGQINYKGTKTAATYISAGTKVASYTFKVNKSLYDYYYLRLQINAAEVETDCVVAIQLEKTSTATNYEPYVEPVTTNIYLTEPLKKVGNYVDYIDFKNKKVVRNIKEYIFEGTEYVYTHPTDTKYAIRVPVAGVVDVAPLSNYYQGSNGWWSGLKNGFISLNTTGGGTAGINNSNYTTEEILRTSLVGLYAQGQPLTVTYALATPTEEAIELPNIPTFKGTTILNVDTKIKPSNIEIFYYENN